MEVLQYEGPVTKYWDHGDQSMVTKAQGAILTNGGWAVMVHEGMCTQENDFLVIRAFWDKFHGGDSVT